MMTAARCLGVYIPIAILIDLAFWAFVVQGPVTVALFIVAYTVPISVVGTSLILLPAFSHGHCEPQRKQVLVFTALGLVFLMALLVFLARGFSEL